MLLAKPWRAWLIRRIHGDLHLGNVVLLDGRPVLFDAIEFSPLIATGDVLYDLAFLLMDLSERGLRPRQTWCSTGISPTRAGRRSRRARSTAVLSLHARRDQRQSKRSAPCLMLSCGTSRDRENARKYFDFACRFIAPRASLLVAAGGLSGTGKSVPQ